MYDVMKEIHCKGGEKKDHFSFKQEIESTVYFSYFWVDRKNLRKHKKMYSALNSVFGKVEKF